MSDLQNIPLNKLVESENNVRRTERKRDIEALAASVSAHGLLQNLTAMDEVEAYAALVDAGASAEDVAQRFGATLRHVEQRLALARLSPRIRAAYRKGEVTLDVARAFCLDPDHAAQERVFKGLSKPISNTHAVRSALTQGRMPASDRLALFVGPDAYAAAGGRTVSDLFESDIVLLEDGGIVQRLALEKAEALRDGLTSEGWGWAEINLAGGHIEGCASERLRANQRNFTTKEKRRLAALDAEIERLDGVLESMADGDDADATWNERDKVDQERDDLLESARFYDPALMAHAGAAIGVDRDGKAQIVRGLIRRADLKTIDKLRKQTSHDDGENHEDADNEGAPIGSGLSKALTRDLTLERTRLLRAGIANDGHVALALLVCTLS
ncbi:MAG: hypothetical protein ABL932_23645, partial [Terricaulis sp.]